MLRLPQSVKANDRVIVYEVIRKEKIYTGSVMECVIRTVEQGKEIGMNPEVCQVEICVVGKIQLGIPCEVNKLL